MFQGQRSTKAKVKMVKVLIVLSIVSVALMAPYFAVQLAYCSSTLSNDDAAYAGALWVYFSSTVAKPVVYVVLNGNFRRGCKEMLCMSAMRCYRSHAYTITTTSTLAKKNHVGVAVVTAHQPPRSSTSPLATVVDSPHRREHCPAEDDGTGVGGSWPGLGAITTTTPVSGSGGRSPFRGGDSGRRRADTVDRSTFLRALRQSSLRSRGRTTDSRSTGGVHPHSTYV